MPDNRRPKSRRRFDHYTAGQREATRRLREIPNIGPAMADNLLRLGITRPDDLVGRDPAALYAELGRLDGARPDPCVLDTFAAAVDFAEGGPPTPWWAFTPARKEGERSGTQAKPEGA